MIEIRVAFYETDAMGVVHHSNYLRYFETARVRWLRERGLDYRTWQNKGYHLPVVESSCRYKRPARFEDTLQISVVARRDRMRLIFEYELKNKETDELLTTGSTEHVAVNENLKVIEPPEDLLRAIAGVE